MWILLASISGCSLDSNTILPILDGTNLEVPPISTAVADPNTLKFIVMGDVGTSRPNQYKVAKALRKHCANKGCDFVMLLGDNIYEAGVDSLDDFQFQSKFERPYQDINIPFHLVLGNHDYGSNGAGLEIQKGLYQVVYTNKSGKWKMPHHYYHYTLNQTEFFALDTQAQYLGLDEAQKQKVSSWINSSNATWKIAYGHHPYKSNGPHGDAGKYDGFSGVDIVSGINIKKFADSVWCGKVDIYFAGHDHSRQWLLPTCSGTQLVISGAGAKVTTLPGTNANLFQANTLGFLYVVISGNTLSADFINANGEIEFSHTLNKP